MAPSKACHAPKLPAGFGFGGHIPTALSGPAVSGFSAAADKSSLPIQEKLMLEALAVSMQGVGHTAPNPAVGCLLTHHGQATVISIGVTESFGGRHAERVAFDQLRAAGLDSKGLDAFVTLEPCSHQGKQPPCSTLFERAGIQNLYVALEDPNPRVAGSGLAFVKSHVRALNVGLARHAATAWHLPFLVEHQLSRPLVAAKWAQTLDGALADATGHSQWITGPESRAYGHWLRLKYDVTVVGLGTVIRDQPSLTVRDCWRPHERQPHVCVMDLLGEARADHIILVKALEKLAEASQTARKIALVTTTENVSRLQGRLPPHIDLMTLDMNRETLGLADGPARSVQQFWSSAQFESWLGRPAQSIFIEGGPRLLSMLLEINAFDLLHIFIAPQILGGQALRISPSLNPAPPLASASHFDILSTFTLGNDMLLELLPERMTKAFFCKD
jgi:diaminohydroxyphosphoribosylaminopyrimidine deaminase/5-amino-6-(5-phosphoribosylamino)uracil reductase